MPESLRERIARAMCLAGGGNPNAMPSAYQLHDGPGEGIAVPNWRLHLRDAAAAISAIESSGTHVVVPVHPTEAMQGAGAYPRENRQPVADVYRAMLAARPRDE